MLAIQPAPGLGLVQGANPAGRELPQAGVHLGLRELHVEDRESYPIIL
jgi:hypothetical protein